MLSKLNVTEIKNYLLSLKKGNTIYKLLTKYFTIDEYKDFTYNTRNNTKVGDFVESLTKELFIKDGFTIIFEGQNGNFIDMMYGIDFIVEKEGEISYSDYESWADHLSLRQVLQEREKAIYVDWTFLAIHDRLANLRFWSLFLLFMDADPA
jgi:hypothetical protein